MLGTTTWRAMKMKPSRPAYLLLTLAFALPLAVTSLAWAGGASLDEDEEDDSQSPGFRSSALPRISTAAAALPTPR